MKSMKMGFYLLFAGMGLLISFGVCSLMYLQFRNHIKSTYFNTLASVARLVERQYPVLYDIEKLRQGAAADADWFWETSQGLTNIADAFDIAYIYYIQRVGTGYVFRMSSAISRDYHPEWLGGPVWTETPTPADVDEAWDKQIMTFSPEPSVEEEWGILVSALLPLIKDGKTIGLLGVDYDISYVDGLQRRVLFFLIIPLVASVILSCLLAVFGSRSVLMSVEDREKIALEANEQRRKIETLMKELKASMTSKSSFMIAIGNEMTTPVNNIIKLSSSMVREKNVTENQRKNLQLIGDSGITLNNVINDIMDINKIEAGRVKIQPVEYLLPNLISGITALYATTVENNLVHFEMDIDSKLPLKLFGDELHIKQVCSKLLLNAFKFTAKGTITFNVTGQWEGEYVWLIIKTSDTGVGIQGKDLDSVFSGYEKVDIAGKVKSGGTGLGLHIIKRMVKMMNGTITVSSEYGKGSTFTLRLRQKALSKELLGPDLVQKLKTFQYTVA